MQIRFKRSLIAGNLSFAQGELLDLPESIAQAYIADGYAVEVPKAERAALGRQQAAMAPPCAVPSIRKARR
jgi:hypothetical protein